MKHPELAALKSIAMLKMEKNFRAQDKGYVRMPPDNFDMPELHSWVLREMEELVFVMEPDAKTGIIDLPHIREEIADVSNCLDYLYEKVLRVEIQIMIRDAKNKHEKWLQGEET